MSAAFDNIGQDQLIKNTHFSFYIIINTLGSPPLSLFFFPLSPLLTPYPSH